MKRLYRLTPHYHLSSNPLFALEIRRVRWGVSPAVLLRASARWLLVILAVLLALWLLVAAVDSLERRLSFFDQVGAGLTGLVLVISLFAAFVLDFIAVSAGLGSINGEIAAGRWDLLRLSLLRPAQIVAAKHGAAQVRVWRVMMLIVALRLGGVVLIVVSTLRALLDPGYFYMSSTVDSQLSLLFGQLPLVAAALIYLVEPYWRMRAITALGVAISARATSATALLTAVGALVTFWLAQGVIALLLMLGSSFFLLPFAFLEATAGIFCISPGIFLVVMTVAVYGFFSIVQTWSLRRAERAIARIL